MKSLIHNIQGIKYQFSLMLVLVTSVSLSPVVFAEYADVVFNKYSEMHDMRPVIFSHWFHRIRFRCKVCHQELGFEMKAGGNDISMGKIIDGQYCGMCHNGVIAWSVDNCDLCHSGKPGLTGGIHGSNETSGPGKW